MSHRQASEEEIRREEELRLQYTYGFPGSESPPPIDILKQLPELIEEKGAYVLKSFHVSNFQEKKSAQQQVYILKICEKNFLGCPRGVPSDQQDYILKKGRTGPSDMNEALESGRHRLVLRIWKGGSTWWNLNQNASPMQLAQQEVMGYRVAKKAFEKANKTTNGHSIHIPLVLHTSWDDDSSSDACSVPWALLEYVGSGSVYLEEESQVDNAYLNGMIKTRMEFGFEEPHPRWGRVPVHRALEYARIVLHQVMIPLHRRTKGLLEDALAADLAASTMTVYTYKTMTKLYQKAIQQLTVASKSKGGDDATMTKYLRRLSKAVETLDDHCRSSAILNNAPPSVLVHMDLQPQNLIFCKSFDTKPVAVGSVSATAQHTVSSVLDWEDAAWADPRFDLLLLCRKVCANREQADVIWTEYQEAMYGVYDSSKLGPIEPWLQLECVHSMATLLLQSKDLLNGGRNPWETSVDLVGKLEREWARWEGYSKK